MKLLLAEDEAITGMMLKQTLQGAGYEIVAVVARGSDAITIAKQELIEAMVMDIRLLDDVDGITAAHEINSGIPVIYCTAYVDPETIARAKQTNPIAILEKPVNTAALLSHLERLAS